MAPDRDHMASEFGEKRNKFAFVGLFLFKMKNHAPNFSKVGD
jgi:hypothetical protein